MKKPTVKAASPWTTYVCDGCGYEYDPAVGDPENGVSPGTVFEALPEGGYARFAGESKEGFVMVERIRRNSHMHCVEK